MITSIALENWKSHSASRFEFSPGVNVIIGRMGAGKSSILQAIVFALFGTFPEIKSRDLKVSETIMRGASEAKVILNLNDYEVTRKINQKGSGDAILRKDTLIAGPQPTEVNKKIEDLLKTDEDTFLRTVYAQQNDIDLFLKLGPSERKKRIDELMRLDRFETARRNSTKLANQLRLRLDEVQKFLQGANASDLNKNLEESKAEIDKITMQQSTLSQDLSLAKSEEDYLKQALSQLREQKSKHELIAERLNLANKRILDLENKLKGKQLEGSKTNLLSQLDYIKKQIAELQKQKTTIQDGKDDAEAEKLAIERKLAVLEDKKKDLLKKQEEAKLIEQGIARIPKFDLEASLTELEALKDSRQNLRAELNSLVKHFEELKRSGPVCPVCASELTSETKSKLVSEREKRIAEISKQSDEFFIKIQDAENKFKELEKLSEIKKNWERKLAELKEGDGAKLDKQIDELTIKRAANQDIVEMFKGKIRSAEAELESLSCNYNALFEKKALYEAKEELDFAKGQQVGLAKQLAEAVFDPEKLASTENKHASAIRKAQELATRADSLKHLKALQEKRVAELLTYKQKIIEAESAIKKHESEVEFLASFGNALAKTQEALRKDLVMAVNEVMASIWGELYPYEHWSGVRLEASESDYKLQIQQPSGEWVSVAGFASGGERMLACLAMRIAFARVLSPGLSLLILDEPTHNLDQRAIETFVQVVQEKLAEFLDQVFIITHDEKLAEIGNVIRL